MERFKSEVRIADDQFEDADAQWVQKNRQHKLVLCQRLVKAIAQRVTLYPPASWLEDIRSKVSDV